MRKRYLFFVIVVLTLTSMGVQSVSAKSSLDVMQEDQIIAKKYKEEKTNSKAVGRLVFRGEYAPNNSRIIYFDRKDRQTHYFELPEIEYEFSIVGVSPNEKFLTVFEAAHYYGGGKIHIIDLEKKKIVYSTESYISSVAWTNDEKVSILTPSEVCIKGTSNCSLEDYQLIELDLLNKKVSSVTNRIEESSEFINIEADSIVYKDKLGKIQSHSMGVNRKSTYEELLKIIPNIKEENSILKYEKLNNFGDYYVKVIDTINFNHSYSDIINIKN